MVGGTRKIEALQVVAFWFVTFIVNFALMHQRVAQLVDRFSHGNEVCPGTLSRCQLSCEHNRRH